jgi:ElaB/YqjD/DUF883 family membrane-anchored ribosome-binding protein
MDVMSTLKDAAYVTIGFGVLAVQRAQVQREELRKQLGASFGDARGGFERLSGTVEDRLKTVEERLEGVSDQVESVVDTFEDRIEKLLDEVEGRLPEQARDVLKSAREAAKDARGQLRELVRPNRPARSAA